MKKRILLLLVISICNLLCGCNVKNNQEKNDINYITMIVYVENNATMNDVKNLENKLKLFDNIKDINYKNKEEIKQEISSENETFNEIIQDWTYDINPFSDTFTIKIVDDDKLQITIDEIKSYPNVVSVNYFHNK